MVREQVELRQLARHLEPGEGIELLLPEGTRGHRTIVERLDGEDVIVMAPVSQRRVVRLRLGQELKLRKDTGGAVYNALVTVEQVEEEQPLLYRLSLPQEVERVQRREHVRLEVNLPAAYSVLAGNPVLLDLSPQVVSSPASVWREVKVPCEMRDISAGGTLLYTPGRLQPGDDLLLQFELVHSQDETGLDVDIQEDDQPAEDQELALLARVIRCDSNEQSDWGFWAACQFVLVAGDAINRIARFVFEEQRRRLARGVL